MRTQVATLFVAGLIAISVAFASDAPKTQVLPVGVPAPRLRALKLDGQPIPLWNALRGKVVIVGFWATWCSPCVAAFPKFNALVARYSSQEVEFFSITYEPANAVNGFVQKHPLLTTIAVDDDFSGFRAYNAWGIPVAYIFDRHGKLAGVMHPDELSSDIIDAVLDGRTPYVKPATPWSDPQGAEKYFKSLQKEMKDSVTAR